MVYKYNDIQRAGTFKNTLPINIYESPTVSFITIEISNNDLFICFIQIIFNYNLSSCFIIYLGMYICLI